MLRQQPPQQYLGDTTCQPLPEYSSLPPLPPANSVDTSLYRGPTEESNWVIFGRLLVGAYPSSQHDPTNTAILTSLLRLGVTTFVCLQQEYRHEVSEAAWRGGDALRPYIFDAIKIVDALPSSFFPSDRGKVTGLDFVHFPVVDMGVAHDASVFQLAKDLCARLVAGEVMYLVSSGVWRSFIHFFFLYSWACLCLKMLLISPLFLSPPLPFLPSS